MIALSAISRLNHARRPYWLAFVFALFLAGQIAGSTHWHDGELPADSGCALCTLSNATGGAATTAHGWLPAVIVIAALAIFPLLTAPLRRSARFHDSRAPPF